MTRRISAVIISAFLLLGAMPALADTQRAIEGEVVRVDRSNRSVVVLGGEPQRRLRFFLARHGEVTSGGQPVELADLKRGMRVEVSYTRSGSTHTAHTIAVAGQSSAERSASTVAPR